MFDFRIVIKKYFEKICMCVTPLKSCEYDTESGLQSKIVKIIINSSDPEELKNKIVKEVAIALNASRCFFIEYDSSRNNFKKITNAYNSKREDLSLLGYDIEKDRHDFAMKQKYMKSVAFEDVENYITENKIQGSREEAYLRTYDIQAAMTVRLEYGEMFLGILVVHYDYKKTSLRSVDLPFLKNVAEHISIALYLSTLYKDEKNKKEQEQLLGSIISIISESYNLDEICQKTLKILGQKYDASALFINIDSMDLEKPYSHIASDYTPNTSADNPIEVDIYKLPNFDETKSKTHYISDVHNFIISHNLENSSIEHYFVENNIKSLVLFPIRSKNSYLGLLIIHFSKSNQMTKDDLVFIGAILERLAVVINQAQEYEKEKKRAERERILRNIIAKIRGSLDIEAVKREIVNQVGQLFKADFVIIGYFDSDIKSYIVSADGEYRSSTNTKTHVGEKFHERPDFLKYIRDVHLQGEDIIFSDLEQYLDEKSLRGTGVEGFYRDFGYVSSVAINISYRGAFFGNLVLTYEHPRVFTDDEINFLKSIVEQAGVAFYQGELYKTTQMHAEREKISKSIVEILRSSLDKNTIKSLFVKNIGKFFKADRVFFSDYDPEKRVYLPIDKDSEYLSSKDEKSFIDFDFSDPSLQGFIQPLLEKRELKISSWDEYIQEKPKTDALIARFENANVKSSYNLPVIYQGQIMGYFCIEFTHEVAKLPEEDINRIRNMCVQAGIALYQSDLFIKAQESIKFKNAFISNIGTAVNQMLNNIVELSDAMSKTEASCEMHIGHLNHINEIVKRLLAFTAKIEGSIDDNSD